MPERGYELRAYETEADALADVGALDAYVYPVDELPNPSTPGGRPSGLTNDVTSWWAVYPYEVRGAGVVYGPRSNVVSATPQAPAPTDAQVAILGRPSGADPYGIWVFDPADPAGAALVVALPDTFPARSFGWDGAHIYYLKHDGTVAALRRCAADGSGDALVHTTVAALNSNNGGCDAHAGVVVYKLGSSDYRRVGTDGTGDTLISSPSSNSNRVGMARDGANFLTYQGAFLVRRPLTTGATGASQSTSVATGAVHRDTLDIYYRASSGSPFPIRVAPPTLTTTAAVLTPSSGIGGLGIGVDPDHAGGAGCLYHIAANRLIRTALDGTGATDLGPLHQADWMHVLHPPA